MLKKRIAVLTSGWSIEFITSLVKGLQNATKGKNIDLYFFVPYKFSETSGEANTTGFAIFDLIDYKSFDGVVITPHLFNDPETAEREHKRILAAGIPAVSLIDRLEGLHYIYSETKPAFYSIVKHLIKEHKLTDLAFVGGPDYNLGAQLDFDAFKQALDEEGLSVNKDNLYLNGDWTYSFGYNAAQQMFAKGKIPQAVVCVNDWAALGVIHVANEHGYSVPEDIIVTGFDEMLYSGKIIPSLTSANIMADKIGEKAIEIILNNPANVMDVGIVAEPSYLQSCGCVKNITQEQKIFTQNYTFETENAERFMSQLRHLEDIFIQYDNVYALLDSMPAFFEKRHVFEGPDFSVLLKTEIIKSIADSSAEYFKSRTYGPKLRIAVNIQNGKAVVNKNSSEMATKDLLPENMKSETESTSYLFIPIFNQNYLHGYYVSKNFMKLLDNKSAYNWSRGFGASIEKFRQKVTYRIMGEQLKELSTKDALSGLLNRGGFDTFATELFYSNNLLGKLTLIIFIDINNMKVINDKHGHLHGDLAVKTVAAAISNVIPSEFLAIRYGGDEFVVIGEAKNYNSSKLCQQISDELAESVKKMSLPYNLSVSLGAKVFSANQKSSLLEAINEVDEIMYKNKISFHNSEKK